MVAIVSGNGAGLSNSSASILGQQGLYGDPALARTKGTAYVNVATGNLIVQGKDDFLAARGLSVAMTRTYNSQGNYDDGVGADWKMGLVKQVTGLTGSVNTVGSTITRIDSDGSSSVFTYDGARGAYVTTDGAGGYQHMKYAAGKWTWTADRQDLMGNYEVYDSTRDDGRIQSSGQYGEILLNYTYNSAGRLATVTSASGESTHFHYDETGMLASVGQQLAGAGSEFIRTYYAYDALQRLTSVITDLTPEDGQLDAKRFTTTYGYDGDSDRIASIEQPDGSKMLFRYELVGSDYKVRTVTDAAGAETSFDYSLPNRTLVTDPLGAQTAYVYDQRGQLTSVIGPSVDGIPQTQSFDYDTAGNVLRVVDAAGSATVYRYDANGNRIYERDVLGNTVTRQYDQQSNQLLSETRYAGADPDGDGMREATKPLTTRYVYDTAYRLRFIVSAGGQVREYRYDALNQQKESLEYVGSTFSTTAERLSESDLLAWLALPSTKVADAQRVGYEYDVRGQLKASTVYERNITAQGTTETSFTTRFVYDQAGLLRQTIDSNQHQTSYAYDGLGRLTSTIDAKGQAAVTTYDDAANKVVQKWANGLVSTSVFDGRGLLLTACQSDASGKLSSVRHVYDLDGRLRQTVSNDLASSFFLYDEAGRKTADIDSRGYLTEYFHDAAGRVTHTVAYATKVETTGLLDTTGAPSDMPVADLRPALHADDRNSWNIYDGAGRLVASIGAKGAVTEYTYNGLSTVTSVTQRATAVDVAPLINQHHPALPKVDTSADDRTTLYCYNADNQLVGQLDADNYLTEYRYAGAQQVETIRYAKDTSATARAAYTGDIATLRPSDHTLDAQNIRTRHFYNTRGLLAATLDAEGYLTEFAYDGAGNLASRTRRAIGVTNPEAATLAGIGMKKSTNDQVFSYTYTALNQLETETAPDGTITAYSYDAGGNVTAVTQARGTADQRSALKRYDALGRLTAELTPEGAAALASAAMPLQIEAVWAKYGTRHAYNAADLRLSSTDPEGHRTLYYYDLAGNLRYTVDAEGGVEERVYNEFNQLKELTRFTKALQPATLAGMKGGQEDTAIDDIVDAIRAGASAETYRYDATGALVDYTDRSGYHTRSKYNAFGELDEQSRDNTSRTGFIKTDYEYDRRGNLISTVPFAGPALATTIAYDGFSRATSTTGKDGVRITSYDRLGQVIGIRNSDQSTGTKKTYDAFGRVESETDAIGTGVVTYTYDTQARTVRMTTAEGVSHTTTMDRLGHTVEVSDNSGNTTRYEYDDNGNLLAVKDKNSNVLEGYTYNVDGTLAKSVDANGVATTTTYDAVNRVLTRTVDPATDSNPRGLNLVTRFSYNAVGNVETVTDPEGIVTETLYDEQFRVKTVTQDKGGANRVTSYTYDSRGNVASITDPNRVVTTITESETGFGRITTVGAGANSPGEQLIYDHAGRVVARVSGADRRSVTRYAYDEASGKLVYELDPQGAVTHYQYDANERLVATTRYATPSGLVKDAAWSTVFSKATIAASVKTDAADQVKRIVYDLDGRVYATIAPNGVVTANLAFDAEGRVTRQTTYAKALDADTLAKVSTAAQLKAAIESKQIASASADTRHLMFYDARGRLTASLAAIEPVGTVQKWKAEQIGYDGNGNVTARMTVELAPETEPTAANIDALLAAARATPESAERLLYDGAGRLAAAAIFQGDGIWQITTQQYDRNGNVTERRSYGLTGLKAPAALTEAELREAIDKHQPLASDAVTAYDYDSANRVITSATLLGAELVDGATVPQLKWAVFNNKYDAGGNLLETRAYAAPMLADAASEKSLKDYVSLAGASPAKGDKVSRFMYDGAGRVTTSAIAQGLDAANVVQWAVTANAYDSAGNLVKRTEFATALGFDGNHADMVEKLKAAPATGSDRDRVTRFAYDGNNRLTATIAADGAVTTMHYDARGNLDRRTAHANPDSGTDVIGPGYAAASPENDRTSRTIFDRNDRVVFEIDAAGDVTERIYDPLGRQTGVVRYAVPVTLSQDAVVASEQDVRKLLTTSALDRKDQYVYDQQGRVRFAIDAAGHVTETRYNAAGEVSHTFEYKKTVSSASGLGALQEEMKSEQPTATTSYTYDAAGHLTGETRSAAGAATVGKLYRYDPQGRLKTFVNEAGATWEYGYDSAGRRVTETVIRMVAFADAAASAVQDLVTVTDYDTFGNVLKRTEAYGIPGKQRTTSYQYDGAGRQTAVTLGAIGVYDPARDSLSAADPAPRTEVNSGERHTVVTYDVLGNAVANTDAMGNLTRKFYDKAGQVVFDVDALGYVTAYRRNAFGEVTELTRYAASLTLNAGATTADVSKALEGKTADSRTIKTEYDHLGRATRTTEGQGAVYDPLGLDSRVSMSAARVTDTKYDAFGNVEAQTSYGADTAGKALTAASEVRYTYDLRGNRTSMFEVIEQSAHAGSDRGYVSIYVYDEAGRLTHTYELADARTGWKAEGFALPAALTANDRHVEFQYDGFGRKTAELRHNLTTYDPETGATSTAPVTTRFEYDRLGKQSAVIDALGAATYTFHDSLGRIAAVARTYIGENAKLKQTPIQLTEYRLDILGNVVATIQRANVTLAAGNSPAAYASYIVHASDQDRTTSYAYNLDGRVIQTIDAGRHASYISYDRLGRVAKEWRSVTDVSANGTFSQTAYTITDYDKVGRVLKTTTPGNRQFVLTAEGGLREQTAAELKRVVHTVDYNAFGEVLQRSVWDEADGSTVVYERTSYDKLGRAWRTNAGDGIDKVRLFDAQGRVTVQLVSQDKSDEHALFANTVTSADKALQLNMLLRTETRYDLLGHVVDVDVPDVRMEVLQREPGGTWVKRPIEVVGQGSDTSLVVVAGGADLGRTVTVSYRTQDGGTWVTDNADRLQVYGDFVVFNTAGLASGKYEYSVAVDGVNRGTGTLDVRAQVSTMPPQRFIELYSALLGTYPDQLTLSNAVARLNRGISLATLAAELLNSPAVRERLTGSADAVMAKIFAAAFGRPGTADDTTYQADRGFWAGQLGDTGGTYTAARAGQAIVDLIDSVRNNNDTAPGRLQAQAVQDRRAAAGLAYLISGQANDTRDALNLYHLAGSSGDRNHVLAEAERLAVLDQRRTGIAQLYVAILRRPPDPAGMDFWLGHMARSGLTLESVANNLLLDAEAGELGLAAHANADFVSNLYASMLSRTPTAAELAGWTAKLGTQTRGQIVHQLVTQTARYTGTDTRILADETLFNQRVTVALSYNRDLDAATTAGYSGSVGRAILDAVRPGAATVDAALDAAIRSVSASLTQAQDSQGAAAIAAGTQPLEELHLAIARLYVAILNRAPDQGGMNYCTDVVWTRSTNLEGLANMLASSPESALGGVSDDAFVRAIFGNAVGRAPTSTEMQKWTAALQQGSSRGKVAIGIIDTLLAYDGGSAAELALKARLQNRAAVASTYATIMGGNNSAIAHQIVARVTSTDVSAALQYGMEQMAAIIAENTKAAAEAAAVAARLEQEAAAAMQEMLADAQRLAAAQALATQPQAPHALVVAQLFTGLLMRGQPGYPAPDLAGATAYMADLQRGLAPGLVAQKMLDTAEGKSVFPPALTATQFVQKLYAQVLGRAPDTGGLNAWVRALDSGATRGAVAADFIKSVTSQQYDDYGAGTPDELELRAAFDRKVGTVLATLSQAAQSAIRNTESAIGAANTAAKSDAAEQTALAASTSYLNNAGTEVNTVLAVTRLLVGLLNRGTSAAPLTVATLTTWNNAAKTKALATVADDMLKSSDGLALFPASMTNSAFLDKLCQQVLGRLPGTGESTYLTRLNSGVSRGTVASELIANLPKLVSIDPSELARRTSFDQRVANALAQVDLNGATSADTAMTALNAARANATIAAGELTSAKNALDAAKARTVDADPSVKLADAAAARARAVMQSPYFGSVVEMYTAFHYAVDYPTIDRAIARFPAGASEATAAAVMAELAGELAVPKIGTYTNTTEGRKQYLSGLYQLILNRRADEGGLNYFMAQDLGSTAGAVAYNFYQAAKKGELDFSITVARPSFGVECSDARAYLAGAAQQYINNAAATRTAVQNAINAAIASAQGRYDSAVSAYNQAVSAVATAQTNLDNAQKAVTNATATTQSTYNAYVSASNAYYYPNINTDPAKDPAVVSAKAAWDRQAAYRNSSNYNGVVEMLTAFQKFSVGAVPTYVSWMDSGATSPMAMAGDLANGDASNMYAFVAGLYQQLLGRTGSSAEVNWWGGAMTGWTKAQAAYEFYKAAIGELYGSGAQRPFPSQLQSSKTAFNNDIAAKESAYWSAYNSAKAAIDAEMGRRYTAMQNAHKTYSDAYAAEQAARNALSVKTTEYNNAVVTRDKASTSVNNALAALNAEKAKSVNDDPSVIAADAKAAIGQRVLATDVSAIVSIMVAFGDARPSVDVVNGYIGQPLENVAARYVGPLNDSTRVAFVQNLFTTILHREADSGGLAYWTDVSRSYTSPGSFAYEFYKSALAELNHQKANVVVVRTSWAAEREAAMNAATNACTSIVANAAAVRDRVAKEIAAAIASAQNTYDLELQQKAAADQALLQAAIDVAIAAESYALITDRAMVQSAQDDATLLNLVNALRVQTGVSTLGSTVQALSAELAALKALDSSFAQESAVADAEAALALAKADVARTLQAIANAPFASGQDIKVVQYYQILLGRAPSMAELADGLAQLQTGGGFDALAGRIMDKNPSAFPQTLTNDGFVTLLYRNGINRDLSTDAASLSFWTSHLGGAAPMTRAALASAILQSFVLSQNGDTVVFHTRLSNTLSALAASFSAIPSDVARQLQSNAATLHEAERLADATAPTSDLATKQLALARLYVGIFGRVPDPSGLAFWLSGLRQGVGLAQVAQAMLTGSPEGAAIYPASLSDADFVRRLFTEGLGRTVTSAELSRYTAQLASSSRSAVATAVFTDAANYTGGGLAEETARNLFNGKVMDALRSIASDAAGYVRDLLRALDASRAIDAANPVLHTIDGVEPANVVQVSGTQRAVGSTNKYTVDRWGNVLTIADERNPAWKITYTYNANGQVLSTSLPDEDGPDTSRIGYDVLGREVKNTDARGNVNLKSYDALGNLIGEQHADGGFSTYTVNAFGERKSAFQSYYNNDKDNPASAEKIGGRGIYTEYAYDHLGQLRTATSGHVAVYSAQYGNGYAGEMYAKVTYEQVVTTFTYDELGRQTRVEVGTSPSAVASQKFTRYDLSGNVIATGSHDRANYSSYDELNRLVWQQDAVGYQMAWNYGDYGSKAVRSHKDLEGAIVTYTYTAAGQLSTVTSASPDGKKQDRSYSYDGVTGRLLRIDDRAINQVTTYGYDAAGNRTQEKTLNHGREDQSQTIEFDAQNRMKSVTASVAGANYKVAYEYDKAGNRTRVTTDFANGSGDSKHIVVTNTFDSMNRQETSTSEVKTVEMAVVNNTKSFEKERYTETYDEHYEVNEPDPQYSSSTETHSVSYDGVGNRVRDVYSITSADRTTITKEETYNYDALGRLDMVFVNGKETARRRYDAAGRIIESRENDQIQTFTYDKYGQALRQRVTGLGGYDDYRYDIYYTTYDGNGAYDRQGNLLGYYLVQGGTRDKWTKYYSMAYAAEGDSWKLTTETLTKRDGTTAITEHSYDANGHLTYVSRGGADASQTWLSNDANGKVLTRDIRVTNRPSQSTITHTLIANDQLIGSSDNDFESFSTTFAPVTSSAMTSSPTMYSVQAGDTLQGIAKALWGDATLWFLIADANGMVDNAALAAGTTLVIPARASTTHNDYQTFQQYDPSKAVGDTTPTLADPAGKGGGCGGLGQILMIVVAVVVTAYTAGLMTPASGGFLNVLSAGAEALASGGLGGGVVGFAKGAAAAMAGSMASQGVGIATGMQDSFDWRGVALSGLSGGFSTTAIGAVASSGIASHVSNPVLFAARAATASVMTQGVAVATGLQDSFSWRNVAASAAGAGVGAVVGAKVTPFFNEAFGGEFASRLATGTVAGFAGGMTAAMLKGGKIEVRQVATDAFGNALGNSLAASARPSSSAATFEQDMDERTAANPLLAAMNKQNRRDLAAEILASQAANENQSSGQDNDYVSIPNTPGDFAPQSTFTGVELGGFMGGSANGLGYDPSKPHVIVYGQKLSKDQWAAIDRYEAGQTFGEFVGGVGDAIEGLPGGVIETAKMVGDGYRGLYFAATGQIDKYKPKSKITPDSFARGIYEASPLGIVGALMEGKYRQAGSNAVGTAAGFATTRFTPQLNKISGLNYDVGAAAGRGARALGEAAAIQTERWLSDQGLILYAVPPESGTPFSATRLRNTPGVATASGELSQASAGWINAGIPAPIPAQVADALVGKTFNSFDDLRSAVWQQVGNNPELTVGFSRANIGQMRAGNAPFAPKEYLTDSGAFGDRFNIHHVQPIAWGGPVYDLSNLQIVTPKVHYNIHYGQ